MADEWWIEGLPIENKYKVWGVITAFILMFINHNSYLWFDYPYRNIVTLVLLGMFIVLSVGSVAAEAIVLGVAFIMVISNMWDFTVHDISLLRKQVFIGSIVVIIIVVSFGKIGLANLVKLIQNLIGNER